MRQMRWNEWDETDEMMCKKDEDWKWKISFYHEKKWEAETLSLMKRSKKRCFDERSSFDESEWIWWILSK